VAYLGDASRGIPMPFVDTSRLDVIERLPGWHGRYFRSPSMTFAHYDFVRGASIHEHFHPQEEVYEVIEGATGLTPTVTSLPTKLSMPHAATDTASRCDTPISVRELSNRASTPRLPSVFTG
jgi:hypothetical protein